jgi:Protein of unknown function (DUF2970).
MTEQRKEPEEPRRYGFLHTMRAVAWGMLGIRKGRGYKEDFSRLNPVYLILAGIFAALVFVLALVAAARWFIGYLTT